MLTSLLLFTLLNFLLTSLPSPVLQPLFTPYPLHPKLTTHQTTITFQGRPLHDQQTSQIIQHFNHPIF
ncbi:YfmQ family protein, partial [Bacillus sp. WP8]|uniref:YfmQ family protein n=1 Tax=Bacillus sp. WP8 TaxID=756828 RepID=UPI0037C0C9D7